MNYNEYSYPTRNLQFIEDLMLYIIKESGIKTNHTILSIGSGDEVHEDFLKVYCNDVFILNDKKIYDAEKDYIPSRENYYIPCKENYYNFVFIKSVIEHINNTDLFLSEIYRVLKHGGKLIILTPDYQKQKDFFYDDYTHIKPFTLTSLKMAVQLNNFKIKKATWFWYYKAIWKKRMIPNFLPCRLGLWLTKITGIKYFRWGSDRQLFMIGEK